MRNTILVVQVVTFIALGFWLIGVGDYRLGIAQLLLAAVQTVIYV